jgi:hypothetical protein
MEKKENMRRGNRIHREKKRIEARKPEGSGPLERPIRSNIQLNIILPSTDSAQSV